MTTPPSMSQEEIELVAEIRDAMVGIKMRLQELTEAVDRMAKAIEQAAEEIRDAR